MSSSEVHAGRKRLKASRVVKSDVSPIRSAVREVLHYGVPYFLPAVRGKLTRGMPTAYAAPPLNAHIAQGSDPPSSGPTLKAPSVVRPWPPSTTRCPSPPARTRPSMNGPRWSVPSGAEASANASWPASFWTSACRSRSCHGQRSEHRTAHRDRVRRLGPLAEQMVFVGGSTSAVFITDAAATNVRDTLDVDAIEEFLYVQVSHDLLGVHVTSRVSRTGIRCPERRGRGSDHQSIRQESQLDFAHDRNSDGNHSFMPTFMMY